MKPLVKICGLRRARDASLAVSLGASHAGVVLAPTSPRRASLDEARGIVEAVGDLASVVLVFERAPVGDVVETARRTGARAVQLFDYEEPAARVLESEGLRVHRVFSLVQDARSLPRMVPAPSERHPAMLDVGGGGTGRRFDWSLLASGAPPATFVAGGITPENVVELLSFRPYGIDLSSGVESAPGVKDEKKLRALFRRIQEASS